MRQRTTRPHRGTAQPGPAAPRLARVLAVALEQSRAGATVGQAVAELRAAAGDSPRALRDARAHCRSLILYLLPDDPCLRRADLLLAAALHPSARRAPLASQIRPEPTIGPDGDLAGYGADQEESGIRRGLTDQPGGHPGAGQRRSNPTTTQNLLTAMRTEAFKHATYLLCARQARADGRAELAELFERVAARDCLEHFAAGAELAGLLGSDAENLRGAARAERAEAGRDYREFAQQAAAAGERTAAEHFATLHADEQAHTDAFRAAIRHLDPADAAE